MMKTIFGRRPVNNADALTVDDAIGMTAAPAIHAVFKKLLLFISILFIPTGTAVEPEITIGRPGCPSARSCPCRYSAYGNGLFSAV